MQLYKFLSRAPSNDDFTAFMDWAATEAEPRIWKVKCFPDVDVICSSEYLLNLLRRSGITLGSMTKFF